MTGRGILSRLALGPCAIRGHRDSETGRVSGDSLSGDIEDACSRCGSDSTGGLVIGSGSLCPACCDVAYMAVSASLELDND